MLVSIAMATYNGSRYIKEQLDSLTSQTYEKIEIIIVDDCSNDETKQIINDYLDDRITLIVNDQNVGCTLSFEKALKHCNGEYIALCDQDDVWEKNKIEVLLKEIKGYSLVYSDYHFINGSGCDSVSPEGYVNKLHGIDSTVNNFELYALFNSFILGCSIMFERALIKKILPIYDNGHNHDKWIVFQAALVNGVKYINKDLFSYRIHGGNLSFAKKIKNKKKKVSTIYFPYDVVSQKYANEHLNSRVKNVLKVVENIENNKIKIIFSYYRYISARYNLLTKVKELTKFVFVSR